MGPQDRAFAAQSVHAVVVTAGRGDPGAVIEAIAKQTRAPEYVTVVTVGETPSDLPGLLSLHLGDRAWVVGPVKARNFGEALRLAFTSDSMRRDAEWYWFLHDDSIPAPSALRELLKVSGRGGSIALIGPKQVAAGDRDHILELGIDATRSGRRADLSATIEIDQGQYDGRDDVLAVGTAGMFVRAEAWRQTRGLDPHLGPFGDGLEYGRRLRRAGYRVVVAPRAVVEHRQISLDREASGVPSFRARREAQLYNWMLAAPALAIPFLLLMLAPWSVMRGVARLVARRPRLAAAEVTAYLDLLLALPALGRGRRRLRRGSTIPTRALAGLELSVGDLESIRRNQRRIGRTRQREEEHIDPLSILAWRRHRRSGRIAFAVVLGLFIVASLVAWYPYLGGMTGAAWAGLPSSARAVWDQTWSTWVFGGVGSPGPANPLMPLAAVVTLPLSWLGVSPSSVALAFMVMAAPLAAVGGWGLARLFTRSVPLRVAAAILWGSNPILLYLLTQGNLASALVWVGAPMVVIGIWRATRPLPLARLSGLDEVAVVSRADSLTGGGFAAVGLLVVASGAPGLVLPAALAGYLCALLPAGAVPPGVARGSSVATPSGDVVSWDPMSATRGRRLVAVTLAWLPAAVLTAPTWAWVVSGGSHLGISRSLTVLLDPTGTGPTLADLVAMPHWAIGAAALIPVWAIAALVASSFGFGGGAWVARCAVLFGVAACVGVAVTAVAPLTVASLSWLVAGLAVTPPLVLSGNEEVGRASILPSGWAVAASLAGVFAVVATLVFGPFGAPSEAGSVIASQGSGTPLVASEAAGSDRAGRLLRLQTDGTSVRAELWRGGTRQQQDLSAGLWLGDGSDARQNLAQAIGSLAVRASDRSAASLAAFDVELVLLPPGESEDVGSLFSNLDASAGFERIGTTDLGTLWRVRPSGLRPAWASLEDGTPVVAGPAGVSTDVAVAPPSTVYIAEVADPAWRATLDGVPLPSAQDSAEGWRQAFQVPAGGGHLTISYAPAWRMWWLLALGASVLVAAVLALPLRSRRALWVVIPEGPAGASSPHTESEDGHER